MEERLAFPLTADEIRALATAAGRWLRHAICYTTGGHEYYVEHRTDQDKRTQQIVNVCLRCHRETVGWSFSLRKR